MAVQVYILVFLALTGYSSGTYCLCRDGIGDQALQKTIDYACGAGADCSAILQNGACYQPNTVKDHCNYAANSYYQRKSQSQGTCDFSNTATISQNPPSGLPSTCVFPSSPSTTTAPTSGTPSTPTPPGSGTTTLTPPTGTTTLTPPTGTTTGGTSSGTNPFSLGPTSTSFDGSAAVAIGPAWAHQLIIISSALIMTLPWSSHITAFC